MKNDPERGRRIQSALDRAGLTQADLARKLNKSPAYVWRVVQGLIMPNAANLAALCNALKVEPGWVIFGEAGATGGKLPRGREVALTTGVRPDRQLDDWLRGTEGRNTTAAERNWLYSLPWPPDAEHRNYHAYHYALLALREAMRETASRRAGEKPKGARRGPSAGRTV